MEQIEKLGFDYSGSFNLIACFLILVLLYSRFKTKANSFTQCIITTLFVSKFLNVKVELGSKMVQTDQRVISSLWTVKNIGVWRQNHQIELTVHYRKQRRDAVKGHSTLVFNVIFLSICYLGLLEKNCGKKKGLLVCSYIAVLMFCK